MAVPVELRGRRTATLAVLRRSGEPFTAAESDVVSRLASLVGLAWATEQYQRQLAEIARLQERERIADELHDRVAQILYAAQLGLDTLLERDTAPEDRERLTEIRRLLVSGDIAIHDVIHDLARVPGVEPGQAPAPGGAGGRGGVRGRRTHRNAATAGSEPGWSAGLPCDRRA